jgi:hypothetical protein
MSFTVITAALTVRVKTGMKTTPIAIMVFLISLPKTETIRSARSMEGKAKRTSIKRIIKLSSFPPEYPAVRPITKPKPAPMDTEIKPTKIDTLAPYRMREKTSLPKESVPMGNCVEGAEKRVLVSTCNGS